MLSIEIRKKIISDYEESIPVLLISQVMRVSQSAIYRLLAKKRTTGSIEASYRGRRSEVDAVRLTEMETLVTEYPDITLSEIKKAMNLAIQKSEISKILREKLGFRFKKRWYMPVNETGQMS